MTETIKNVETDGRVEVQVTRCPECGTEWERVVTRRRILGSQRGPVRE